MKRSTKIKLILATCFAVVASVLITQFVHIYSEGKTPESYYYTGKVLLSEERYNAFKLVAANEDVDIHELEVYASDPRLVIFTLRVPADITFNYGEIVEDKTDYLLPPGIGWYIGFGVLSVLTALILFASALPSDGKKE